MVNMMGSEQRLSVLSSWLLLVIAAAVAAAVDIPSLSSYQNRLAVDPKYEIYWTADTADLGYAGAAIGFGALLALIVALHYATRVSKTILFWLAFVLTRPLGAVVGDYLDKPLSDGGLALSRYAASAVLVLFMIACLWLFPSRATDSRLSSRTH